MEKRKLIYVDRVLVHCCAGAELTVATREATILALTEERKIVLAHNARRVIIDPDEIISYLLTKEESDGKA